MNSSTSQSCLRARIEYLKVLTFRTLREAAYKNIKPNKSTDCTNKSVVFNVFAFLSECWVSTKPKIREGVPTSFTPSAILRDVLLPKISQKR